MELLVKILLSPFLLLGCIKEIAQEIYDSTNIKSD